MCVLAGIGLAVISCVRGKVKIFDNVMQENGKLQDTADGEKREGI